MAQYRRGDVVVEAVQVGKPSVIATRSGIIKGDVSDWLVTEDLPEDTKPHYGSPIPGILVPSKVNRFFVKPDKFAVEYVKVE